MIEHDPLRPSDAPFRAKMAADADAPGASAAKLSADPGEIATLRGALAAATERERLLEYELQHRVRNMLAVLRSIFRRTRAIGGDQEQFAEHYQGRFDAIARLYSHVQGDGTLAVDVEDMLRDELLPTQWLDKPACVIDGPAIKLTGKSAELLGLAIHELATNSIKFGALGRNGTLRIDWSREAGSRGSLLRFRWAEAGVPLVAAAPRPSGFGRELIEDAIPYQLGAATSFELRPGGMECVITLPWHEAGEAPEAGPALAAPFSAGRAER